MLVGGQVDRHRLNGHCPAVHSIAAAPPEAQRSLRALRCLDLIDLRAGAFRFLKGLAAHVTHAGKVHHQPFGVCSDMRIVLPADGKVLLSFKHPGRIAGQRLCQPEKEVQSRHEIQREQPELDANPEHQRYAEHAAQHHARMLPPKEQNRRRQIGQAVDDQQGNAGKHKILKQQLRQRHFLEK